MSVDDKLDLILRKLEENEKRLSAVEDKVKAAEKANENIEDKVKSAQAEMQGTKPTPTGNSFLKTSNRLFKLRNYQLIILIVAVIAIVVYFSYPTLTGASKVTTSAQFFEGPVGQQLGQNYIIGLSNLASQLQSVGGQQISGKVQCIPAQTTSNGPAPKYCALSMSDNDYNIIPIPVAKNASVPTLSNNGKPTFVYIGAQGCPFCAQQRWAFAVALSRFGNFSSLFYDKSATDDGNVPTFMFNFSTAVYNEATSQLPVNNGPYGDSNPTPFFSGTLFSSQYINFEAFDQAGGSFLTNISGINALSPNIYTNVYEEGNAGINVPSGSSVPNESKGFGIKNFWIGGVPFFDINNQYVFDGATTDPVIFNSNGALLSQYSTHSDLLNSIENPTQNSFGETVLGAANILTAEICSTINNTAPVCKLSYISGLQNIINSAYA